MPPVEDDRRDDDDDRPRRRRRREEDDDDFDDRPRQAKKGMSVLLILAIVGGVLILPILICAGLLLPAVQKVRMAAGRSQSSNNLKQLALAQMNDESTTGRGFYGPFAHDELGGIVQGHSARVSLLPYLEQDALYKAIDLKQPWDSPRNSPSTSQAVKTLQSPDDPSANPSHTPYRMFVGGGALFNDDGKPVRMADITDGTSNTIMYVTATEQVPWAKPQELKYGANLPLPALGNRDGFLALMADGSVKFIRKSTPEATIRALITKAGGETVPNDF